MNRLQKKCILASTGIHLLLALMLILGPAFLSSRSKQDGTPPLDFIAYKTVDDALSGGGDNTVKAPPALSVAPPADPAPVPLPPPVAPPVVQKTPDPVPIEKAPNPTPALTPKTTPRDVKPPKNNVVAEQPKPKPHQIVVSTTPVISTAADVKAARDAQAKAAAAEKRRTAEAVSRAMAGIQNGVSGSTEVRLKGPGGGGVPYGNFKSAIQKIYQDAWSVPDGAPELTVSVTITVAKDGTIISARITNGSGNAALDNSVQKTLDRVKHVPPLPDSETEESRTLTIGFNPEQKLTG